MSEQPRRFQIVSEPRTRDGAIIAEIFGEIDLNNSPMLRDSLLAILLKFSPKRLVLNLQGVPYMDSSAIAVLVEILQKIRRGGGKVLLISLQPRVKGLLEIARLDTIFILAATEDEALVK